MLSLYGNAGMGSAGLGMGALGAVPPQALMQHMMSPQMLAMMAGASNASGAPHPMPAMQGPVGAPTGSTPMAGFIGMGSGAPGGMRPPMPAPAAPVQGVGATPAQPAGGMSPQLMQMLQMMHANGQTGVSPLAGMPNASGAVFNPQNPVGTSALGGATANQGSAIMNYLASLRGVGPALFGRGG